MAGPPSHGFYTHRLSQLGRRNSQGAGGWGGGWEDGLGIQSLPDAHKAFGSAPTSGRWGKEKGKQLRGKSEWVGQVLGSHQAHLRDRISLYVVLATLEFGR